MSVLINELFFFDNTQTDECKTHRKHNIRRLI